MNISKETVIIRSLDNLDPEVARQEQIKRNQAVIELLRSWEEEGDEEEQTETWEYLRTALDEDRLSNRPLFP